jgi:hypothetical protein
MSKRRAQRGDQKLNEVNLFHGQWSALLGHLETVEHLEGDSQPKLWSEGLDRRRLLNASVDSRLQVQTRINGGRAYGRGDDVNGMSGRLKGGRGD